MMRKLVSLALVLALALALATPALAAEPAAKDGVGVFLNSERLNLAGAQPELRSGQTMVPVQALTEALGGAVSGRSGVITCTFPDRAVKTVTIRTDGAGYYKNGQTYVPVRALAEPLGFDVFWDSTERSAVLVDRAAVIAGIDEDFTILNGVLKTLETAQDPDKNYKTEMDYVISMDVLDEYSGKRTKVDVKMKASMLASADAMEMTLTLDMSSLADMLELDEAVKAGHVTALQAATIRKALGNLSLEGFYDMSGGHLYFRVPVLAHFNDLTGMNAKSTDWYHLTMPVMEDMEALSMALLQEMGLGSMMASPEELNSIGGVVYLFQAMYGYAPAQLAGNAAAAGDFLAQLFGDANFQSSGASQKLHIGVKELAALLGGREDAEGMFAQVFEALGLDLTVRRDGSLSVSFEMVANTDITGGESVSAKGGMEIAANKVTLDMTLKMGDLLTARYTLTETIRETREQPRTTPPAGATVVELGDLEELMGVSLSTLVSPPIPVLRGSVPTPEELSGIQGLAPAA